MIYATGYIEEDLAVKLDDVYLVGKKEYLPLEVVLDTGFSDQFCLPITYKNQCKHDFLGDSIYVSY